MTTKIHPFEQIKTLVNVHTQARAKFKQMRAGIDDPGVREFVPCVATDFENDEERFDVSLVGITLRCVLTLDAPSRKGVVTFAHVRRDDVEHPVPLGEVPFNIRNGYTELHHFTDYADDNVGEPLDLSNPYGMKEVLARYFLQAAGVDA